MYSYCMYAVLPSKPLALVQRLYAFFFRQNRERDQRIINEVRDTGFMRTAMDGDSEIDRVQQPAQPERAARYS